jgi:hypothetical protein
MTREQVAQAVAICHEIVAADDQVQSGLERLRMLFLVVERAPALPAGDLTSCQQELLAEAKTDAALIGQRQQQDEALARLDGGATLRARIVRYLHAAAPVQRRTREIAAGVDGTIGGVAGTLSLLVDEGVVERPAVGLYTVPSTDDGNRKRCGKCRESLPVRDFAASGTSADGRQGWCRSCHHEYGKERTGQTAVLAAAPAWMRRTSLTLRRQLLAAEDDTPVDGDGSSGGVATVPVSRMVGRPPEVGAAVLDFLERQYPRDFQTWEILRAINYGGDKVIVLRALSGLKDRGRVREVRVGQWAASAAPAAVVAG